jgi:S-adenosylmethionine:tRNA ribosyltransferase-isomerase
VIVSAAPPPELREAERPPEQRGLGRDRVLMLVADPEDGSLHHGHFDELPELLGPPDVLVVNTSRTLPAALPARAAGGARVLLHLSTPAPGEKEGRWIVELRTSDGRRRGGHAGQRLQLPAGAEAELLAGHLGSRLWVADLRLGGRDLIDYLEAHGRPIRYGHAAGDWPLAAYQNVYANEPGSAEMPSAGRPFTAEAITRLVARGVDVVPVVLHTGVSSLDRGEPPYPERFEVSEASAARINLARSLGGRVIAVGTTSVRALESAADPDGHVRSAAGWTHLVIGAGRPLRTVEGVLSGFHDRGSSHLELLEGVAGTELLERAYASAREHGYLRHEFGDVLLVLPGSGS